MNEKLSQIEIRPYRDLPEMNIDWLRLKDHFISTVGPHSGQGRHLKDLLVLADAKIQPHSRFPDHPHEDMEILTWVVQGTLQHLDNNGSNQEVSAEHLQFMSAREGIFHAEGNTSSEPVRILQIWIRPNTKGGKPLVQVAGLKKRGFNLLAAPSGSEAQVLIRQEAWLSIARLDNEIEEFTIPEDHFAYAVSVGNLLWNEKKFQDGDGAIIQSGKIEVSGHGQAILILQKIG